MNLNDLMTSETTTQEPTYSGGLDFNVISAVEEEKKSAKDMAREKLTQHLKNRSDLRRAIRSGEKSSGNKDVDNKTVNTSTLADTFTDVMVSLGKDPAYMQERYGSSEGNMELINKMKGLQGGKFSGDIQNYIDGKNTDLTGLVNNMFPDYIAAKTGTPTQVTTEMVTTQPVKNEEANVLKGDTRSGWDKMADKITNFQWSDIGLESERKPIKGLMNIVGGFTDATQKTVPGTMDIINQLTMTSPEDYNKAIDEGYVIIDGVKENAKERYDRAVKYEGYKGTYNQWVNDRKNSYADFYNKSTSNAKSLDESRGDYRFNTMDRESPEFRGGQLGSEVAQQIVLDKLLMSALSKGAKSFQALRGGKEAAKGTELATKGAELAVKGEEALANPKTMQESKKIGQKIVNRFNKPLPKAGLEGGKAGLEFQLIGDVQDGQLSDAQAYGISAGLGTILSTLLYGLGAGGKAITSPNEKLATSLKRIGVKDVDEVINWSKAASKDTLPSAKQRVADEVVKEAKKSVKGKLDDVGEKLGDFRKNLGWSDLTVSDFKNTINKSLTNKGIGAQIVEKDGKYIAEGYPGNYGDVLNKIVDRMNSAIENVKNKYKLYEAGEKVDFGSNTSLFEDLISDLKHFSKREPDAEVRQKFIEIENSLLEDLKGSMTDKQWEDYQDLLKAYADNKTKYSKIEELERKMNLNNVNEQPKMEEDGQYLSDFLEELYNNKEISKNAKDRRIVAIFADALYGVPLKPGEKVPYPSKNGWLEEVQRWLTKMFRNPESKLTGGRKSYAQDYVPSTARKTTKNVLKKAKDVAVGKTAQQPKQE